jgi:hypothetical protein
MPATMAQFLSQEDTMSRAFVNEDNAAAQADQPVERQVSAQPNYVTPQGLAQLQAKVASCKPCTLNNRPRANRPTSSARPISKEICAISTNASPARRSVAATSTEKVQIGSWVTFADEHDTESRVQLVGEDQADASQGLINWGSPLGRALLGARLNDEVLWQRPADQVIEVIRIEPA